MTEIPYKIVLQRQKMYIRGYAIVLAVILLGGGGFFFTKWQEYVSLKNGVANNQQLIASLNNEVIEASADYTTTKVGFDEFKQQVESDLRSIFPATDQYKELTRKFDEFEKQLNQPSRDNPFEVSSLDFQPVKTTDDYSMLPMRMNVRSSRDNFTKFLHLIETSGSLNNKSRLMDISSIRLNFSNTEEEDETEIINFTVQINAYFQ